MNISNNIKKLVVELKAELEIETNVDKIEVIKDELEYWGESEMKKSEQLKQELKTLTDSYAIKMMKKRIKFAQSRGK